MTQSFHVLSTLADLDAALAHAAREPIVLFKHSETCGMSLQAHGEVTATLADPAWTTPVYLVSVQQSRPVCAAIAEQLGVRHQSPQILLVDDGRVSWHTSHLAITVDALFSAVETFAPAAR
jgi:bacillithiol system protein YtxJ